MFSRSFALFYSVRRQACQYGTKEGIVPSEMAGSSPGGSVVMNPTNIHEDAGNYLTCSRTQRERLLCPSFSQQQNPPVLELQSGQAGSRVTGSNRCVELVPSRVIVCLLYVSPRRVPQGHRPRFMHFYISVTLTGIS